jgi:hypothetical protein
MTDSDLGLEEWLDGLEEQKPNLDSFFGFWLNAYSGLKLERWSVMLARVRARERLRQFRLLGYFRPQKALWIWPNPPWTDVDGNH